MSERYGAWEKLKLMERRLHEPNHENKYSDMPVLIVVVGRQSSRTI
jgi:hypothetical protein